MSKTCLGLSLSAVVWLSAAANAQEPAKANVRKLVVSGSATLQVKPDAARITFVVLSKQLTGNEARAQNERHVKQIRESLQALKVKNADIHAQPASLSTVYSGQNPDGTPQIQGKQAQTTFVVLVRDKDEQALREGVLKLADVAAENGGTALQSDGSGFRALRLPRLGALGQPPETVAGPGIEWLREDAADARRQAIKQAVADALANAQAAVGGAKVTVMEINVSTESDLAPRFRSRIDPDEPQPALIAIRAHAQVTCSY